MTAWKPQIFSKKLGRPFSHSTHTYIHMFTNLHVNANFRNLYLEKKKHKALKYFYGGPF